MIGPIEGPTLQTVPHARLLYSRHFEPTTLWSEWAAHLNGLDALISEHPRLELANSGLYLYFFGPEAKESWVGREIVGHLNKAPEGFGVFDSYKSEVFNWVVPQEKSLDLKASELLKTAQNLRDLAGESLADTWRVALESVEPWTKSGQGAKEIPQVTFQFYKKD